MVQKIRLSRDGVVVPDRMQPYHANQAKNQPAKKLSRLQKLLKTKEPRICVVRGEGIGDVLMTTPVVHDIRNFFETVQLHYATNTRYLDGALVKVLQYNPDIDEILERELLDESKYDLVMNLHCPCIYYEKRENPPINRIDLFARHLGVRLSDPTPRYFIQKSEIETGRDFIAPFIGKKVVLAQPYASTERRSLDLRKFKDILKELAVRHNTMNLVLTHGSDFNKDIMWNEIPHTAELKNLDIRQIAGIMAHSNLVLCPDSSILHLAGALGVPTVALFGPTHPMARINHYPNAVAIWKGDSMMPCPCWYQQCPIGETCWKSMTVDEVVNACASRLNANKVSIRQHTATIKTEIV